MVRRFRGPAPHGAGRSDDIQETSAVANDDRDDEELEAEEASEETDEALEEDEAEGSEEGDDADDDEGDADDEGDEANDDEGDEADDDEGDEADDDEGDADDDEGDADDDEGDDADDEGDDADDEGDDADDEGDDDDDDEERPRAKKKRVRGKKGKKVAKRKDAAARLAAARAAKAARKAAKRGKELQNEKAPIDAVAESRVAQRAAAAGSWASENRPIVLGIVAAIVLAFAGGIGWYYYAQGQSEAAGQALADAIEIAAAEIRAEDEIPDEDDGPSYTSATARAEAALEAYQAVIDDHGGTEAAIWAQLGRGEALLDLGRHAEAREAFERAIQAGGDDAAVVWRGLEGKGFTYEAEENWEEALGVYRELSRVDDGRFDPVAKYHIARMYIARGETEQATETLSTLVESLREAADDEDQQEFAYVLAQAEVRLRELDPSAVPARPTLGGGLGGLGGGGAGGAGVPGAPGGGAGGMSPEQIQQLMQKLRQSQGGGGE